MIIIGIAAFLIIIILLLTGYFLLKKIKQDLMQHYNSVAQDVLKKNSEQFLIVKNRMNWLDGSSAD